MATIQVTGNRFLNGNVSVGGAKNAAIPLMCASLLAKGKVFLKNVPRIKDVFVLINLLKKIDCKVIFKGHTLLIDNSNLSYKPLLFEECAQIRGSYYLIGVFLSLFSKCEILLPGGCNIGKRPIDLHLNAFEELGFKWEMNENILYVYRDKNVDFAHFQFAKKSVGASLNALFAGLSAKEFKIENVLLEPEGLDVINFLNKIGYDVKLIAGDLYYYQSNIDTRLVKHSIIFDRMEAMTYAVMGLLTGKIKIKNVETKYIKEPLELLKKAGYIIEYNDKEIDVYKSRGRKLNLETYEYPGFPTDLQSVFGVLCAFAIGKSTIKENIFENRLQIYYDLQAMGVNVKINDNYVELDSVDRLKGRVMKACDLRHGAALVLLALKADGISYIENYEYVERGYEAFLERINKLGGSIIKK